MEDRVQTAHRRHCPSHPRLGIAEELAQDALVTALELSPEEGILENPGAWLMTAAKLIGSSANDDLEDELVGRRRCRASS